MKAGNSKLLILAIVACLILVFQARSSIWNQHAQVDILVMWQRVQYWLNNFGSWTGMMGNEILPATLLGSLIPLLFIPSGAENYPIYLSLMIILNLLILIAHGMLAKQQKQYWVILIMLGPLLLFRYDAWVTLVMILGLKAFERENYSWAGWWMGLAVSMKVFPIIILPYLLIILYLSKQWRSMLNLLTSLVAGILIPIGIYVIMGGTIPQIRDSLAFHSQKLISIESVPGSVITAWELFTKGRPPDLLPGNGIWAVPGPAVLFNKIWILPIIALYYWWIKKWRRMTEFDWDFPLCLIVLFLIFSKNLNPQYIWWFITILAMTSISNHVWKWVGVAAITNQIVFPVYYSSLIDGFFLQNTDYWIFGVLLLRNISVAVVAFYCLKYWWRKIGYAK